MPAKQWSCACGASSATFRPYCGGACTSWSNAKTCSGTSHPGRRSTTSKSMLACHCPISEVSLSSSNSPLRISCAMAQSSGSPQHLGGVQHRRVVGGREAALEPVSPPAQLDLRSHVVAEPAFPAARGASHCHAERQKIGPVECQLQHGEAAHGESHDRHGRLAHRLDQACGVDRQIGDRPRRLRPADGVADSAVRERGAAEGVVERWRLPAPPGRSVVASPGDPHDIRTGSRLLVGQITVANGDAGHGPPLP